MWVFSLFNSSNHPKARGLNNGCWFRDAGGRKVDPYQSRGRRGVAVDKRAQEWGDSTSPFPKAPLFMGVVSTSHPLRIRTLQP
jgi:hypothetical protein